MIFGILWLINAGICILGVINHGSQGNVGFTILAAAGLIASILLAADSFEGYCRKRDEKE